MSYELIATIVFLGNLIGMGVILFRKIPILSELPEGNPPLASQNLFLKLKQKLGPIKTISSEKVLQKFLSKLKILTLKTENKTSDWLERLRQKSLKEKKNLKDNYWQELKRATNQKNKKSKK